MSTQVRWRRGTAAQHSSFTGAEGELTYDTTNKTARAHDGTTAGGWILATQSWVASQLVVGVADGSLTPAKFANTTQNTIIGRIASGSGAPSWLTATEVRQAAGFSVIGSAVGVATDMSAALAGLGVSGLLLSLWGMAR